jgi:hypothetical protein
MQQFIEKYGDQITGVLSGLDRLVFRAAPRRLNFGYFDKNLKAFVARGMQEYCWQNKLLFKDYQKHVKAVSERVKKASLQPFRKRDLPVVYVSSPAVNKDELARNLAQKRNIESGLVCAISALEPSPTFEHRGTHIIRRTRPCHVLYQYQIHPKVGWTYARIQTWFPFNIQIGLNGREWLARQMDQAGLQYVQAGNCFPWIEDFERAQKLLDEQLKTHWPELLNSFAHQLNPLYQEILALYPSPYYWTCFQSEWATDLVFRDAAALQRLMSMLVPHALSSFSCKDVLRYFNRRINQSGEIPANFHGAAQINLKQYPEGQRLKYALDGNSIKNYDKAYTVCGNVLRAAETTINNVKGLKEYRTKEGDPDGPQDWLGLRKGIAGIYRRVEISRLANNRAIAALASIDSSSRVEELTEAIQRRRKWEGGEVRALRPWAEDKELLRAVGRGEFQIQGLRNRDLQALLYHAPAVTVIEQRRRSAAVSRKLRMLRAHGIIKKITGTHRYVVTKAGLEIIVAVLTTARTSVNQLNRLENKAA